MFLIAGLGNPGKKYENTRHNAGFMAVHKLSDAYNITSTSNKFNAVLAQGRISREKVVLAQPLTYMNKSGQALKPIVDYFKIPLENVVVIYDDMNLPAGKIRIKKKGSAGGHNGLKSVLNLLGDINIPRIRIGIDTPPPYYSVTDYVLGKFSKDEKEIMNDTLDNIPDIIKTIIEDGYDIAMNKYN